MRGSRWGRRASHVRVHAIVRVEQGQKTLVGNGLNFAAQRCGGVGPESLSRRGPGDCPISAGPHHSRAVPSPIVLLLRFTGAFLVGVRGEPQDGCSDLPAFTYLSGLQHVGRMQHESRAHRPAEKRGYVSPPAHMEPWGHTQPLRGLRFPWAIGTCPADRCGSQPGARSLPVQQDGAVLLHLCFCGTPCCAPAVPRLRPCCACDARLPCRHCAASDHTSWEEGAHEVRRETPRQVLVGMGVIVGGTV